MTEHQKKKEILETAPQISKYQSYHKDFKITIIDMFKKIEEKIEIIDKKMIIDRNR